MNVENSETTQCMLTPFTHSLHWDSIVTLLNNEQRASNNYSNLLIHHHVNVNNTSAVAKSTINDNRQI